MSPIILGYFHFSPLLRAPTAHGGEGGGYVAPAGLNRFFSLDIVQGDRAHALSYVMPPLQGWDVMSPPQGWEVMTVMQG